MRILIEFNLKTSVISVVVLLLTVFNGLSQDYSTKISYEMSSGKNLSGFSTFNCTEGIQNDSVITTKSKDSIKFVDKLFSKRNSSHQFVLDMEFGIRLPNYGINYFYRFNRFGVGSRLGFNTFVTFQGAEYGTRVYVFLPEILLNYRVYKTINVEFGMGIDYTNLYKFGSVENRLGIQTTFFKYTLLRLGIQTSYDIQYKKLFILPFPYVGVGITI